MKYGMKPRRKKMSGDQGLFDTVIVFYHEEMTEAKRIVLKSRGIKLAYLDKNVEDAQDSIIDSNNFWKNEDTN